MGDEGNRQTTDQRQLEARLAELEGRLRVIEHEPLTTDDGSSSIEAEIRVMREALDDLASDVLDLHNQMATLVSACERILAGAAGGGLDITLDRDLGSRGSGFVVRRAARRAVRATLGVARRVLGPGSPEDVAGADFAITSAVSPATRLPKLAVVVETEDDLKDGSVPTFLDNQTDPDTEIVVWNAENGAAVVRGTGKSLRTIEATDRSALVSEIGAEFIAVPTDPHRRLLPTVLEICRWTLASEGLPLVVGGFPANGRTETVLRVHDADHWCRGAGSAGGSPLVKLVGSACRATPGSPSGAVVWTGRGGRGGYLMADTAVVAGNHEVASLDGAVSALAADDPRPCVLVATPLSGGAFELVMWLLQGLGDRFRFSVFLTEDCGNKSRLARAMAELAPEVYPLANFLEPSVWPSALADLARARSVTSVLRVGSATKLTSTRGIGPPVIDFPLAVSEIEGSARTLVALSDGIATAVPAGGPDVVRMTASPALPPDAPQADGVATVRSGLGVPDEHRLVVGIADLVSDQRPEDFVAVAHRMRHRPEIHFLLVGEGDLTGTVSDLARYFGLENFVLAPQTHSTFELVLAADIVMSTAERDPWPTPTVAALALGRCLVATAVEGRRELAAVWDDDRTQLVQPGDVIGLAEAVETAVGSMRKPRATKKAWQIARSQSNHGLRLMAEALKGGAADPKGDG